MIRDFFFTMIAEQLITPHPEKQKLSRPEQLYASLDPEGLRSRLEGIRITSDAAVYDVERVRIADMVANEVNNALWLSPYNDELGQNEGPHQILPRSIEQLDERQLFGCFGYTITLSEILDEIGIEHWIAHSNGPYFHAFVLLPSSHFGEGNDSLYLIDPLFAELNIDISDTLSVRSIRDMDDDIRRDDISRVVIDGSMLADKDEASYKDFASTYKWTAVNWEGKSMQTVLDSLECRKGGQGNDSKKLNECSRIITTVFASSPGRHIINQSAKFRQATFFGRYEEAADIADDLYGFMPDIDARQSFQEIGDCVQHIATNDEQEAYDFLERYLDSPRRHSTDSRIEIKQGDILRSVALQLESSLLLEKAGHTYEKLMDEPLIAMGGLGKLIAGKLNKVKGEMRQVQPSE